MAELELKLFYFLNKSLVNPVFDFLTPILTIIGEYDFVLVAAFFLIIFLPKEKRSAAVVLLTALLVLGPVVYTLKTAFPRQPPFISLEDVRQTVEELDPDRSFPSGHTAIVFLIAAVLSSYFGRAWLLYPIALAASLIRVYSGDHYVSDVLAGAILGGGIGYVTVFARHHAVNVGRKLFPGGFFTW